MTSYGQTINLPDGYVSCSGYERLEEAIRDVVDLAIDDGWLPREHWWQFWRNPAPSPQVLAEYKRRKTQPRIV